MSRRNGEGPDAHTGKLSSLDRFVTTAPWELPSLNRQWRPLLRRVLREHRPRSRRIAGRRTSFLIFDDTQHPRTGWFLEGAGYHWSHTEGKSVWSHSLVTGECQRLARLSVDALVAQLVPAALLSETGVPFPAAAVTPAWQTVTVAGRTLRVLAYRGRLPGMGPVQLVLTQERHHHGGWSPAAGGGRLGARDRGGTGGPPGAAGVLRAPTRADAVCGVPPPRLSSGEWRGARSVQTRGGGPVAGQRGIHCNDHRCGRSAFRSRSGSTGLTRCSSNPALRARAMSPSWP
jgi:hypothetical protein